MWKTPNQISVKYCDCQQLLEVAVKLFPHLTKHENLASKTRYSCLSEQRMKKRKDTSKANNNPNKATGQDNIAPRVLTACAQQLAYIFCIIFNACFSTNTVPTTWKTACIVPIPKRPFISSMNDLRPVALTSAVINVCEWVILCKLKKLVKDYIDPLQFADRKNRSTDDAVLYSLENTYSHLEKNRKHCKPDVLWFFQCL